MTEAKDLLRECRDYFAARYIGEPAERLRAKLDAFLSRPAAEPAAGVLRDAERYRWLRLGNVIPARVIADFGESMLAGNDLDHTIDAALERERGR